MFPMTNFLGTPVDTYALCTLTGFIAIFIAVLLLKPKEFPTRYVFWGILIVFVFAFMGANLFNVLLNAAAHKGHDLKGIFMTSGLAYLGAPVFGLIALWIYCRAIKISFMVVADYVVPFLMVERVFGRLGCLGYGCCYGIPSDLPWAYPFLGMLPSHPTQAYELAIALAILISSIYLYKRTADIRRIKPPSDPLNATLEERKRLIREAPSAGIVLFYVFLAYGFLRFFNEFLRAEGPFLYGPFKVSHLILSVFVIASIIGLFGVIKKSSRKEEILKALKESVVRLFVWLVIWLAVVIILITIHNHA